MLKNADSIQEMITTPKLSGISDKTYQLILSQAFMKQAEVLRPWTAIGFDEWIRAARWWLLKAQSTLYSDPESRKIEPQAFADLLKASFILIDIIPQHPQRRFWTTEYADVEILADALKAELEISTQGCFKTPELALVESSDLRIWADAPAVVTIKPRPGLGDAPGNSTWRTASEEVIFRGFATFSRKDKHGFTDSDECIVLVTVTNDLSIAKVVAQSQYGRDHFSELINFGMLRQAFYLSDSEAKQYPFLAKSPNRDWSAFEHEYVQPNRRYLSRIRGLCVIEENFSLMLMQYKLLFPNLRDLQNLTTSLTAIVMHQEIGGLSKSIESLRGLILMFLTTSRDRHLIAEHVSICGQLDRKRHERGEGGCPSLSLAISTGRCLLVNGLALPVIEFDRDSPHRLPFGMPIYEIKNFGRTFKAHVLSCWLLSILYVPIMEGLDWLDFVQHLKLCFPDDWNEDGTSPNPMEALRPAVPVLAEFSLIFLPNALPKIAANCPDLGMYPVSKSILNSALDFRIWDKPHIQKLHGTNDCGQNLLYMAICYDSAIGAHCFLNQSDELGVILHNELLLESERCQQPGLYLALYYESFEAFKVFLEHIQLSSESVADLILYFVGTCFERKRSEFLVNRGIKNMVYPSEVAEIVPDRTMYLEIMVEVIYDISLSYFPKWDSFHSGNWENALEMLLQHKAQLATEALDNALIRALEVGNLMAARILASYGAQNTSRATILRAELIDSIYSGKPHRLIWLCDDKPSSLSRRHETTRIRTNERFSKCINWLLGGIYEVSPLEDDMLFWRIPIGMEGNLKVISMEKRLEVLRKRSRITDLGLSKAPSSAGELMFPNSPKSQKIR
jgi:hypothetical protein